jgi:hypothetical protein
VRNALALEFFKDNKQTLGTFQPTKEFKPGTKSSLDVEKWVKKAQEKGVFKVRRKKERATTIERAGEKIVSEKKIKKEYYKPSIAMEVVTEKVPRPEVISYGKKGKLLKEKTGFMTRQFLVPKVGGYEQKIAKLKAQALELGNKELIAKLSKMPASLEGLTRTPQIKGIKTTTRTITKTAYIKNPERIKFTREAEKSLEKRIKGQGVRQIRSLEKKLTALGVRHKLTPKARKRPGAPTYVELAREAGAPKELRTKSVKKVLRSLGPQKAAEVLFGAKPQEIAKFLRSRKMYRSLGKGRYASKLFPEDRFAEEKTPALSFWDNQVLEYKKQQAESEIKRRISHGRGK